MKKKKTYRQDKGKFAQPDLELNTISANDCMGLIPAALTDEMEQEFYEELYPYEAEPND